MENARFSKKEEKYDALESVIKEIKALPEISDKLFVQLEQAELIVKQRPERSSATQKVLGLLASTLNSDKAELIGTSTPNIRLLQNGADKENQKNEIIHSMNFDKTIDLSNNSQQSIIQNFNGHSTNVKQNHLTKAEKAKILVTYINNQDRIIAHVTIHKI